MAIYYNTSRKPVKGAEAVLRHFSPDTVTGLDRVQDMFVNASRARLSLDGRVMRFNVNDEPIGEIPLREHLEAFANFAASHKTYSYDLNVTNPLKLIDHWDDDPIGSGGFQVVDTAQLTGVQQDEIKALFHPFTDTIYSVDAYYGSKDIKRLITQYSTNAHFKSELKKRKQRAAAIGLDFDTECKPQEVVWLDLTFKLKAWAERHGFDSFRYDNTCERGQGECIITFKSSQVVQQGPVLRFDTAKYLAEAEENIHALLAEVNNTPADHSVAYQALWGGVSPARYYT